MEVSKDIRNNKKTYTRRALLIAAAGSALAYAWRSERNLENSSSPTPLENIIADPEKYVGFERKTAGYLTYEKCRSYLEEGQLKSYLIFQFSPTPDNKAMSIPLHLYGLPAEKVGVCPPIDQSQGKTILSCTVYPYQEVDGYYCSLNKIIDIEE